MNLRGPALILVAVGCISLPALRHFAEADPPVDEAPKRTTSQNQAAQACTDNSVRIGKVWVGCEAQQLHKKKASRIELSSKTHRSGAGFVKVKTD